MKRFACFIVSAIILLSFLTVSAHEREYHFYIKRGKDHAPAKTDPAFDALLDDACFYRDAHAAENDEKRIYLTFDAGYENGNVAKILDILKKNSVTGAFFVLAHLIDAHPDLLARMKSEGHLICNHTARHKNMAHFDDAAFKAELGALEEIYTQKTGESLSKFYRPPEGSFSFSNIKTAKEMGYKTVFWSLAYCDWNDDVAPSRGKAIEILKKNTHNGAIVLLHPTSQINVDILQEMIDYWKQEGYVFGSLEEVGC